MTDPKDQIWHYMDGVARAPPPARTGGTERPPPRTVEEGDLVPLRQARTWSPSQILATFGPAPVERAALGRLMVACAVLQGAHRALELAERLIQLLSGAEPRAHAMLADDTLAARRDVLRRLTLRLAQARAELGQTRARAANDADPDIVNPDGLTYLDLKVLAAHVRTAVICHELGSRRNVTGIDFGLAIARQAPDLAYAEEWLKRVLGSATMNGFLLFWPPKYGRLVVVHADGRLAYDPGPLPEEPDV